MIDWKNNVAKREVFPKVLTTTFSLAIIIFTIIAAVSADEITQNDFTIRTADKDGNVWQSGVYSWGAPVYVNVVNNKASGRQASVAAIFGQSLVSMKSISVWNAVPTNVETITETCETRNATTNSTTFFEFCWHNSTFANQNIDQWASLDFSAETSKLLFTSGRTNHSPFSVRRFKIDFDQPKNTAIKFNISVNESGTFAVLDPTLNSTFLYHQNMTYNTSNGTANFPTATVPGIVLPFRLNGTVSLFGDNKINASCFDVIVDNSTNALTCQANERSCRNGWDSNFWQWCKVDALSGQNNNTINWGSNLTTNQSTTGSGLWSANATLIFIFDENASATPNVANAIIDSSGDGNHGQLRNYTTVPNTRIPIVPCLFGSCPNFTSDTGTGTICVPDSASLDMTDATFTLEMWATHNGDCTAAASERIAEKWSSNGYGFLMRNSGCDVKAFFNLGNEQILISQANTLGLSNGSWHHIMINVSQSGADLVTNSYFDGKWVGTNTFVGDSISASSATLNIGNYGEVTACTTAPIALFWRGAIGYFALWDGTLGGDYAMTRYRQYLTQTYSGQVPEDVAPANVAPTVASVTINATKPSTGDSLNCSATPTDATNTTLLVNFSWYKNNTLQFIAQSTCLNNTLCNSSRLMPSINKSDAFICGANVFDGTAWSNETNSTSLNVTLPLFPGWDSSTCFNVTNTGGQAWPVNTSINISLDTATLISSGKMRSDCGDMRVGYNANLESQWVISPPNFPGNGCNNAATTIVFKTVNITPGGVREDFCVHYNNSGVTYAPSNASAFIFFDDFNRANNATVGTPVIGTTWLEYEAGTSTASIASNQLKLNRADDNKVEAGSSYELVTGVNLSLVRFMFKTMGIAEDQDIRDPSYLRLGSNNGTTFFQVKTTSDNVQSNAFIEHGAGGAGLELLNRSTRSDTNTFNFTMLNYSMQNTRMVYLNQTTSFQGVIANAAGVGYSSTNAVNNISLINASVEAGVANVQYWVFDDLGVWLYPMNDTLTVTLTNVTNTAPTVNTPTITPSPAFTGNNLNCSGTASDIDGGSLTVNFSWYKSGVLQFITNTSCTAGTLCNSSKLMPSINKSEVYACGIKAFDTTVWSGETNSTNLTVSNTAPVISASNFSNLTGTYINTSLVVNATYTDLDLDAGTVFFNWSVNGVIKRLTNYTLAGNGSVLNDTFYPGNHTRGDVILVNISSHDGTAGSNIELLTRTVSNYGPANTSTVLNASSAVTGDNLNCSVTPSDPENATLLVNFSWYKNGAQDLTLNNQLSCTNSTQCNASKVAPSVNKSDNWFCRSQVFDGGAWSNITNSTALTVSNSAPAMQSLTPTTGTLYTPVPVSIACNATDIDLADDITYDISGLFRTLSQGSQSWQSIVTSDADGLFTWDISSLAGQSGVDLNCSASDGTASNLSFNPTGTLIIDRAPNITLVNVSPDVSAFTNQTLNCSATVVDDLQTSMTTNFTWYNALVLNASALVTCGNNTLCNGSGIPSINTSRAQNWTCAVTVTDGVSNASSVNDTVLVVNSPPNVENVTLFPTPLQPNTKLNCSARLVDADGDTANITFAFYKNGVLQSQNGTTIGVLNGTTANSSNTVPASGVAGGDSWLCSAQAFDTGGNESTRLNASNATVNNAPQIINITTVPANLSQAIGSTAYWVVNVTDSDNDLSWCNMTLYWPNQTIIAGFDNVNITKSPSGDLWNSSNVTISVGGYYNASMNCSDGAQNQSNNSLISAVQTIINQTGTNYSTTFFDNSQFKVNYSTDDIIQSAYINITWPNATIVQYNMSTVDTIPNKTYRFNTTNITLTQFGTYSLRFFGLAGSGENNITTDSFNTGAAIQSNPDAIIAVPDPREKVLLITLSVWQDTVANLSYNFSSALVDSSGNSVIGSSFSINFSRTNVSITGPKTLNNSDTVLAQINGSLTVPDGLYTGNITIVRVNDSQTNVIPITLGINPPAGKATAVTSTSGLTSCSGTTCDWRPIYTAPTIRQSNSFFIKNTGNFTLSNCNVQLSDDLANATWLSVEEAQGFSLSVNQTVVRNVLIDSPPSGSFFGYFDAKCKATALGYNDSISSNTSNQPRIFVSALFAVGTQGASGGAGGGAAAPAEIVLQPINESAIVAQVLEEIGEICGDGACGSSENPLGCSSDCKVNVDSLLCITGPDCSWRQNWFAKGVVFGTLGLATIVAIFSKGAFLA